MQYPDLDPIDLDLDALLLNDWSVIDPHADSEALLAFLRAAETAENHEPGDQTNAK